MSAPVLLACLLVLALAGCDGGKNLAQRAVETCGKGKVAYVDTNSQQFGCKR